MKYIVRKEFLSPQAVRYDPNYEIVGTFELLEELFGDVFAYNLLDQGFIEPYEEKPKIISDQVRHGLQSLGSCYVHDAIFQLEEAIIALADNEVSDE